MKLLLNEKGNYQFLTGIAPYSAGVVAVPGYEIVHITLQRPVPYLQGFDLIERYLKTQTRPRHALCALELRSPKPFTFEGFAQFNQSYQHILTNWELLVAGHNPIARTNIAPAMQAPAEPSLYAFSVTSPQNSHDVPTFVVAGAGDLVDQAHLAPEAIVRPGETSSEAMQEKAAGVMATMEARLTGLQVSWAQVTAVDIYTTQPLHTFLPTTILDPMHLAAQHGVRWFYSHPPIEGLAFEMDVRGVRQEVIIEP